MAPAITGDCRIQVGQVHPKGSGSHPVAHAESVLESKCCIVVDNSNHCDPRDAGSRPSDDVLKSVLGRKELRLLLRARGEYYDR